MGQYSFAASVVGFQLGMASYAFSIRNFASGKNELESASEWLPHLAPLVAIQFNPQSMQTEQDVINLRQQIADKIASKNAAVHDVYQLGLHIGLAVGQSLAPASVWSAASVLCVRGLQQAEQDLRLPTLAGLGSLHYDKTLSDIVASISPKYDPQLTNRILIPWNATVRPAIGQQPSLP